jgi:hypothetical protein
LRAADNYFVNISLLMAGASRDEKFPAAQRPSFKEALHFWFKPG